MTLDDLMVEIKKMNLLGDAKTDVNVLLKGGAQSEDAEQDLIATALLVGIKQDKKETKEFFSIMSPLLGNQIHSELVEYCLCNLIIAQLGPYIMYGLKPEVLLQIETLEETIPEEYCAHLLKRNKNNEPRYKDVAKSESAFNYLFENISLLAQAKTLEATSPIGKEFVKEIATFYNDDEIDDKCAVSVMRFIRRLGEAADKREAIMKYRETLFRSLLMNHDFFNLVKEL